jgi:hypothetical protein
MVFAVLTHQWDACINKTRNVLITLELYDSSFTTSRKAK